MKRPDCRVEILALLMIVFLASPVLADDLVHPMRIRIFFEKDGTPYNSSVNYTFRCFGATLPGPVSWNISEIYEYSAMCSGYGCNVWQPEPRPWLYNIQYCELQGTTRDTSFYIKNLSLNFSCTQIPPFRTYPPAPWGGSGSYFLTPETEACMRSGLTLDSIKPAPRAFFRTCNPDQDPACFALFNCTPPVKMVSYSTRRINNTDMGDIQYRHYLDTCDPLEDENCPGWFVDGIPLKKNHECRMNMTPLILSQDPCWRFLVRVNRTLVLPPEEWNRHIYQTDEVSRLCYVRWTIPPDNQTPVITSAYVSGSYSPGWTISPAGSMREEIPVRYKSPIEYLYCSILSIFGARC